MITTEWRALQSLDDVQEEAKALTAAPSVNRALKDTYPALTR